MIALLIIFLVLGLIFVSFSGFGIWSRVVKPRRDSAALIERGVTANGVLLQLLKIRGRHSYDNRATFQFAAKLADGNTKVVVGHQFMSEKNLDSLRGSKVIAVRYLPENPDVSCVDGFEGDLSATWLSLWVGLVGVVVGVSLLIMAVLGLLNSL